MRMVKRLLVTLFVLALGSAFASPLVRIYAGGGFGVVGVESRLFEDKHSEFAIGVGFVGLGVEPNGLNVLAIYNYYPRSKPWKYSGIYVAVRAGGGWWTGTGYAVFPIVGAVAGGYRVNFGPFDVATEAGVAATFVPSNDPGLSGVQLILGASIGVQPWFSH